MATIGNTRSFTFSRPKSIFGLALLGFSVIIIPLIVFTLYAWNTVGELAYHSEQLVVTGTELASESEMLQQELINLERNARQYHVTGDRSLFEVFEGRHSQWTNRLKLVDAMELNDAFAAQVAGLLGHGTALMEGMRREAPGSARMRIVLDGFDELYRLVGDLSLDSQRFVSARLNGLLEDARAAQHALTWQVVGLVAIIVLLSVILVGLIACPVRRTAGAIRKLGDGAFNQPIEIGGPRELAALGHELDWLRRRLVQLNGDRDRFLRHVSHDLKTPLASVCEGAELLVDGAAGPLNATQTEIARILNEASSELQLLIENLLTYDAAESREVRLKLAVVELQTTFNGIIARHRLVTARKHIDVQLDCPPLELVADPEKLAILFDNLLSNAIRFAPTNGRVQIEAAGDDDFVTIDVVDNGPGVEVNDRERIFEPFYQGRASGGAKVRSTGLGLAVARECAEHHAGSVRVQERPQGTCFRVLLPRGRERNAA